MQAIQPRMKNNALWRHMLALFPVLCIGVLASQPFLSGQVSQRGDTLLHLQRLAQVNALMQHGVLYSRWAPDLALGFGYPLFNYYAPLAYYVMGWPMVLGVSQTTALAYGFVMCSVMAAIGMYLWCRNLFGNQAALVAAAAYVLSPYILTNAIGRGALAEQFALALLPGLMWAVHRLALGVARSLGLTVGLLTALLLGHNISALLFLPLLTLFAVFWMCTSGSIRRKLTWLDMGLATILSLGLAAFFWLPALAERDLVYIERTTQPAWANLQNNFVAFSDLLSWPTVTDPNLIRIEFSSAMSPFILLGLITGIGLFILHISKRIWAGDRHWWVQVIFLAASSATCLWMTNATSAWLWRLLPLSSYVQFPSRLIGPASMLASAFAGAVIMRWAALTLSTRLQTPVTLFCLILLTGLAFHHQVLAAPLPANTSFDPQQMAQFEARTSLFGSTSGQEYTPRSVLETPGFTQSRWNFQGDWFDRTNMPKEAEISKISDDISAMPFVVRTPIRMALTLRAFAFPGWQAYVDGAPSVIIPTQPYGFISLDIPAGTHQVQLRFGSTPIRRIAEAISFVALLACGMLIGLRRRHNPGVRTELPQDRPIPSAHWVAVGVCALGLLLGKQLYIDHANTPFIASRLVGDAIPSARWPARILYGDRFEWIGADGPATAKAGDTVQLKLYWRVTQPITGELSSSIQLIDSTGRTVAQSDNFVIAGLATFYWEPGQYAVDEHKIVLPASMPPGLYQARVVVYPRNQPQQQLPIQTDTVGGAGIILQID